MINKKSIWFVTLFSLVLVLSVYYITMPSELLLTNNSDYLNNTVNVEVKEDNILTALKVEENERIEQEMANLRLILNDDKATSEQKNEAFEKLKIINLIRGEEEKLVNKIKNVYNLDSYVNIDNDQIKVVTISNNHDKSLANSIIRTIQEEYKDKKYITVKFQN